MALAARRRAFAEALGRLVADLVWRELVPPTDGSETGGGADPERCALDHERPMREPLERGAA